MEEPSLDDDYEGWAAWYDAVKAHRDALADAMRARGIRTLPAATKGTGWHEAAPREEKKAEMADPLTLYGQKGGGL